MPSDRQTLGDHVLLGSLPWGRMVEHAHARKAGGLVALRLLRVEYGKDPVTVEAFVARGRAALQFRHPNLVRATQVGRQDGHYFVATEYVAGQTLAALLERCRRTGQRLSLGHVAAIAHAIASALDHAHPHLHPVHPHPGDVLIGYDGVVRLLASEAASGAPAYIAPEQVRGQEANQASDQFVLGAITFEMLTLEPAFSAENEFQSLEKVRRAEVPPPSLWNDRVPTELDEIVRRAAAREPDKRFPDVRAMAQALSDLQKGFMFGSVDLADLLARTFPDEVRAEAATRSSTEEEIDAQTLKERMMRAPRALALEPIYWLGLVVIVAGVLWLAAGY